MGDKNIKNESLNAHNKYRKDHGAPPLKWSSKLQNNAQKWANELAKKQSLQHANQQEEGENLSYVMGKELTAQYACDMWYNEIKDYNYNRPGFSSATGHFTQVVWVGSEELGVAKAVSPNGKQYIVARYYPPGNNTRTFKENVLPKGSKMQSRQPVGNTSNASNITSPKKQKGKAANATVSPKHKGKAANVTVSPKKQPNNKVTITTTTTTASSSGTTSPARSKESNERQSDKSFQNTFLRTHNMYRKRHAAAPLKWNSKLAKAASDAAVEASNTNTLRALDMENTGQNMIVRSNGELPGEDVSYVWYSEESKYNYNSPGFTTGTGKFSQMVWKETKEVGVGRAINSHGQTFVVALYQPPGNVRGNFPANVATPTGPMPTEAGGAGCSCVIL